MVDLKRYSPYSTLNGLLGRLSGNFPEEELVRLAAYEKYDQMYWNDPKQFRLRVLEGESPLYIPSARTVVDTTAHFLLKNLSLTVEEQEKNAATKQALEDFLAREAFFSQFHTAKHTGVTRGDFAYHLVADPEALPGQRISLLPLDPAKVLPTYDQDNLQKLLRVDIISPHVEPDDPTEYIRKLSYWYDTETNVKTVYRSEGLYLTSTAWWTVEGNLEVVKWIIPPGPLDSRTPTIPVYWFKNLDWMGQTYGSSDLRGLEFLTRAISQGATDTQMTLSLEGLGVYATDGGRPVDDEGNESDWEVFPGRVMEVPSGSYFRRVEGVGSITPMMDQQHYVEDRMFGAAGLSDVARGAVDVAVAQSGIALKVKFIPTQAKLEQRDLAGLDKLRQLFYDWVIWYQIYEGQTLPGRIIPAIGQKLPDDPTTEVNVLNNMLDRKVISKKYYRERMNRLGFDFPRDIDEQIQEEKQQEAELAALTAPPGLASNAAGAVNGTVPPPPGPTGNSARNARRVNESRGTEADQTLERQARR